MDNSIGVDNTGDDAETVENPVRTESDIAQAHSDNDKYPDSRIAGLKPWGKDNHGNLNGRPKGAKDGVRAELNRLLRQDADPELLRRFAKKLGDMGGKSNGAVMAQVHFALILKGDMNAIREAYAQTELPHPKNVNVNGDFNVSIPGAFADAF